MREFSSGIRDDFIDASRGALTHGQWLKKRVIQAFSQIKKSNEEFTETLQLNFLYLRLGDAFLMDLHRLLEFQVLKGHFANRYVPRTLLVNRLRMNIGSIDKDRSLLGEDPFRLKVRSELDRIFQPVMSIKFGLPKVSSMPTLPMFDVSAEDLEWAKEGITIYEKICVTLSRERPAVMARLAEALTVDGQPLADLQKIAFEESVNICRIALILRDASALLGIDELGEDIHPSIADLIMLEGIEPYLASRVPLPLSPPPSPTFMSLKAKLANEQIVPTYKRETIPARPQEISAAAATAAVSPNAQRSSSPNMEFKLENRNLRKVLQKLQQAGFQIFRTRGHHILKRLDGGASVVVPTHGDVLKEGTVRNIEKQAREALGSPRS